MANIMDLQTLGEKWLINVDADPSAGAGTAAPVGSIAIYEDGSNKGMEYVKTGVADTAWELVITSGSEAFVGNGLYRRLAIYATSPNGTKVDDSINLNSQAVDVIIVDQAARTVPIEYSIPNPGNAVSAASFVLTEGVQLINGDKTFGNNIVINGDLNVKGMTTYVESQTLQVADKLITINKGGPAASGSNAGLEIEEGGSITGGFYVSADRMGFAFDAPASNYEWDIDSTNLTSSRKMNVPDEDGRLLVQSNTTPGVIAQVPYFASNNRLASPSGVGVASLAWDNVNNRLGIGTNAPAVAAHVVGSVRSSALTTGVVKSDSNGTLINGQVILTSEVSGVLPVANGGTNSGTALNNNRIMISNSGSIVEAAALTNGQLLIGSTGAAPVAANITQGANQGVVITNGAGSIALTTVQDIRTSASPTFVGMSLTSMTSGSILFSNGGGTLTQDNANLFFDNANNRLGVGTNAPARSLDVNGNAIIRNDVMIQNSNSVNYEIKLANASTTDATVTNVATIAIPTGQSALIEARIIGKKTAGAGAGAVGDSCTYIRTARFKNVSGTVSRFNLQSDYTSEDQAGWNGTMIASTGNAVIQVQGSANNNMSWHVTYKVQLL